MSQPDLFVVCRNCGAEVSPYVTECPYCGQRVRKRAPRLDRPNGESEARPRRRSRRPGRLQRPRALGDRESSVGSLPLGTIALVAASVLVTLALATEEVGIIALGGIVMPLEDDPWRYLTTPFIHDNLAFQFVALAGVAVFGTALERRAGPLVPIAVFLIAGVAGAAAAVSVDLAPPSESSPIYVVIGANGAALGLLAAWLADVWRSTRRGEDPDVDLMGAYVFAVVLLLVPLAVPEASLVAGLAGALAGFLVGIPLSVMARR